MRVRINKVILLLLLVPALANAAGISASLKYKVNLVGPGTPTDAVVDRDGAAGIYDAFDGTYSIYENGEQIKTFRKDFLKGGNCFVKNGNYYLYCNSSAHTLDMLSRDMEQFASFALPENFKGDFDPTDALVSDGAIYTVDNDGHRVFKMNPADGSVEQTVGGYGQERLGFWYPFAIAIDKKGVLYISEVLNTRIQKITKELKFYEFIGKWGINPGEFYRPTGIALYKDENLLVADGYTGIIQYFDSEGKYAGYLIDSSGTKLEFKSVTHIRINGSILAVVDAFAKTVYIYELKEH